MDPQPVAVEAPVDVAALLAALGSSGGACSADVADGFVTRLRDVHAGATKKIRYEYDFSASWWHEATPEKVQEREPGAAHPICTAFANDPSVEEPSVEEPQDPEPLDVAATNRRLAGIGQPVETDDQDQ